MYSFLVARENLELDKRGELAIDGVSIIGGECACACGDTLAAKSKKLTATQTDELERNSAPPRSAAQRLGSIY